MVVKDAIRFIASHATISTTEKAGKSVSKWQRLLIVISIYDTHSETHIILWCICGMNRRLVAFGELIGSNVKLNALLL